MSAGAARSFTYRYPRPSVTVDALVFRFREALEVLLITRGGSPEKGKHALPGGFVDPNEDLGIAVKRELEEETSVKGLECAQVGAFGTPFRDPRGHTITVAYLCVVPAGVEVKEKAADDAATAKWYDCASLPPLAFDHDIIMHKALSQLHLALSSPTPALLEHFLNTSSPLPTLLGDVSADTALEWTQGAIHAIEKRAKEWKPPSSGDRAE